MAEPYGDFLDLNGPRSGYNPRQQGVFALHPLATPKYARNQGARDGEFKDTLARIYVSLADASDAVRAAYLASLPGDQATQALARVLLGAGSQGGTGFVDFFLSSAQMAFQEISQVDKVLSDDYVAFYFGQAPPTFQYSGMLLNSLQDDQATGFARAYLHMLRGTQLARRNALVRLRYDSYVVSGTMSSHSQMLSAENELAVPFSFTLLVKEFMIVGNARFSRTSPADYVKLAADASIAALSPVGTALDARVRAVAVTPAAPVAAPSTGVDARGGVTGTLQALRRLIDDAQAAGARDAGGVPNVRGAIDPRPPTPPAPP